MKIILFLSSFILLSLFKLNIIFPQELEPSEIYDKVNNSVVMIYFTFEETDKKTQGSGVVVNEWGIIITNYHLIKDKPDIKEILIVHNKDTINENIFLIGSDSQNDILILKVNDYSFQPIKWAEKHNYKIGETIYTISSPYELENSFTIGEISGLNRNIKDLYGLIQFTATVDLGSSGGALLNSEGELIGIIVCKYQTSNANFAIPINLIWDTYMKSFRFIIKQKLDVIYPDYENRINLYIESLSDTVNLYEKGYKAYIKGDFADVIFYYSLYLEKNVGNDNIYYQRGRALFAFNYDSLAVIDYEIVLKNKPERVDLLFELGIKHYWTFINYCFNKEHPIFAHVDSSYVQKAQHFFYEAINTNPDYFPPYVELTFMYQNTFKNYDSCLNIITRAINRKKNIGFLYYLRSGYNKKLGYLEKEINDLNKAIKFRYRDSLLTDPYFYFYVGDTSMSFSNYFIFRGKIYYSKKNFEKAIKDFTSAINCEISSKDFYFNLNEATYLRSLSYYELEEYELALKDMEWLINKSKYKKELEHKIKDIKNKLE